jgi:hypothetical protein
LGESLKVFVFTAHISDVSRMLQVNLASGKLGFSSYQKCSAAIRMLAYGVADDLVDEYMRMSESTCIDAMCNFCRAIIAVLGEVYL